MHIRYKRIIPAFLIFAFSIVIYGNSLKNGFVYDDADTIVDNAFIKDIHNLQKLVSREYLDLSGELSYRPVVTLTYFFDYSIYGFKPWGYHLTNVIIHSSNGVLLYIFLLLLDRSATEGQDPPALRGKDPKGRDKLSHYLRFFMASLLFSAHPVLTEAVNAVSFREDLLAFLFYMASLIIYIKIRAKAVKPSYTAIYLLSCITYALALLSKEMAVTLPLIVFLYEWVFADKKNRREKLTISHRYNAGYIIITLAYLYLRFHYFSNPLEEELPSWRLYERILTVPWLVMNYLQLSLFPVFLSADYRIRPIGSIASLSFIIPLVIFTSLLTLAWTMRKRRKDVSFGILFFVLTMLPVYNLVTIANPLAERYLYIPIVGLAVAITPAVKLDRYILVLFLVIFAAYSVSVVKRNGTWRDNYSLWFDTILKMPNSPKAHYNMGNFYKDRQQWELALYHWKRAVMLQPNYSHAYSQIGTAHAIKGEYQSAIEAYEKALGNDPNNAEAHYNIAVILEEQGDIDEAVRHYRHFVEKVNKMATTTTEQVKRHIDELERR